MAAALLFERVIIHSLFRYFSPSRAHTLSQPNIYYVRDERGERERINIFKMDFIATNQINNVRSAELTISSNPFASSTSPLARGQSLLHQIHTNYNLLRICYGRMAQSSNLFIRKHIFMVKVKVPFQRLNSKSSSPSMLFFLLGS